MLKRLSSIVQDDYHCRNATPAAREGEVDEIPMRYLFGAPTLLR